MITDFKEYIRQNELHKREKGYAWQTAIGLQAVDGLKTSNYLRETARQHIEGDITIEEVKQLVNSYYESKTACKGIEGKTAEVAKYIAQFVSDLWQIHPFGEGNMRTTAAFIIKYLHTFGFDISDETFANYSLYFRNALVRTNYNNMPKDIFATTQYLEAFFSNLILGEQNELKNRFLHISAQTQSATVHAPKCNYCTLDCTLEELALLNFIKERPNATQKEIAVHIGKSERTVKTMTVRLSEQGIIVRKNGRRNGYWEVKNNEINN